ncbi:MAG: cytochrome c-type biosis protein [Eubacteriales bacterium]|nr:cytochrome c-type biosis protein [Eubacteriales bacterium]
MLGEIIAWLQQALAGNKGLALILVYLGGVLTSISPCVLSTIPLVAGYIGSGEGGRKGFLLSFLFVVGMSTTFAAMGLLAASVGMIFGQVGRGWYYFLAALAIVMGLHLLEVIHINFPSLQKLPRPRYTAVSAYLLGLLFGLAASPCATPVLAVIVAYVAARGEPLYGGALLFIYGLGHGLPLLITGAFAAAVKGMERLRPFSRYVNYVSGTLLIIAGLYFLTQAVW